MFKDVPGKIEPEALQTLLRISIKDTKNLFAPMPEVDDPDLEVEAFRSYVYEAEGMYFITNVPRTWLR